MNLERRDIMSFDYISDVHVDFWISKLNNQRKSVSYIKEFINYILPEPEVKSNVLIIAGDISNLNSISKFFLEEINNHYELILLVWGNHDYYLDSKSMLNKYNKSSFNKIKELEEFINSNLHNIKVLNGNVINYEGVNYGGTGLWYNLNYTVSEGIKSYEEAFDYYSEKSNDYVCVRGKILKEFYKEECEKMYDVLNSDVDVVISHIVPSAELVLEEVNNGGYNKLEDLDMYLLNNQSIVDMAKGKVWVYGHLHGVSESTINDTTFLRNCVGYPEKKNGKVISLPNKIKTYEFIK